MPGMIRRIILPLATALMTLGLLVMPGLTPKAEAYSAGHYKVGTITGRYIPAPYRDYRGESWPQPSRCLEIQRLSGNVVWTTAGVNGAHSCTPSVREPWSITDDSAVANTYGIRMYVSSGTSTGSYWSLCNTKSECLAMRGS